MYNIVVVDDEQLIADGLAKIVHHIDEKYNVVRTFYDSVEAWEYLQDNYNEINLLITDIRMSKISGLELIERVHGLRPQLTCAVLTGFSDFEYAKEAIRLGVVRYLVKPVEMSELRDLLIIMESANQVRVQTVREDHVSSYSRETQLIKKEIEDNYRLFDINSIAERLQLSKEYLFRVFKKEIGFNISDYLLKVRIEKARELLSNPNPFKVYEISEMVGYEDYAYFSKLFKKMTGMTPKSYQKYSVYGETGDDEEEMKL